MSRIPATSKEVGAPAKVIFSLADPGLDRSIPSIRQAILLELEGWDRRFDSAENIADLIIEIVQDLYRGQ
jgi:hypothetical protein